MIRSLISTLKQTAAAPFRSYCSHTWNNPNEVNKYLWQKHFRVNKTRCYFPRPSENMRIKKHGWVTRMSTEGGRKVLMNRILKGRHVLSH